MKKIIDCFFIGHNEMEFEEYEKHTRKMGIHSGAYRDLNLNFIQYDNKPYSLPGIFNLFYSHDPYTRDDAPPLSLGETFGAAVAYLGTYLHRRGFTFDYVNSFQEEKEKLKNHLEKENILSIAITTTLYTSVLPILEIMEFIKKHNRTAKIILGGPFVSTQIRSQNRHEWEYLFQVIIGADIYVNSSQGETALVKIIHALKNNLPLHQVDNIYYKTHQDYSTTAVSIENNKLSRNMVDWNLFSDRINRVVNTRTAISCPFSCAFCGYPQHAGKFQTVGVEPIENELKTLDKIRSLKSIRFTDDTFNVPKQRFKEILKMFIKNKFKFKWQSNLRCQFLDRETAALMKQSKCEGVFLGLESGSEKILKNMNKAANVEKYLNGIALLKEAGILTLGSFIIGFPGETPGTVQQTTRFIETSGIDFFRVQLWYCEPVTPIWQQREKYRIKGSHFEWSHQTMNSKQASDMIDDIFLSVKNPTWIPQYNFDLDGFFYIVNRGFSREEAKNIVVTFNRGIKDKLRNPTREEVSVEIIKQLKEACQGSGRTRDDLPQAPGAAGEHTVEKFAAEFDFQ